MKESVISSEHIYEGKVIRLRRDRVRFESGREGERDVVEHNGAVAIVAIAPSGKVLLVSQWRAAVGELLLEIPAGSINPGEDPDTCAHRELIEETQFAAGTLDRLFEMYSAPGFCTEKLTVYLAGNLRPEHGIGDDDEFIEVSEVPLSEAIAMIDRGQIRDAKSIAGLLAAARRMAPPAAL